VPAIGFSDSAEDAGGWKPEGFTRIEGPAPQKFIVQAISEDGEVRRVDLRPGNKADIPLDGDDTTIAISAASRGTVEVADYDWSIVRTSV
jgi:hypothetical protein